VATLRSFLFTVFGFCFFCLLVGCTNPGKYVWIDSYSTPGAHHPEEYVISSGDVLNIHVWDQEKMSGRSRVRPDGKISLPLLNDVVASGLTPDALSRQIEGSLKQYLNNPVVTVSLEETKPFSISIVGEVVQPGAHVIEPGTGVVDALAKAGGLNNYAAQDSIYVIRRTPSLVRIRFRYQPLLRAEGKAGSFRLMSGDVIVVE
jgi:polysaccharide export outer membrane protein